MRVLTAYTDVAAIGFAAAFVEHEYPLASCGLEEGAARDEDGLLGLAQLQIDVIGLACADVLRALAPEDEVAAELPLSHLGIDLAHLQLVLLVATGEGGCQSLAHAVDIVLVNLRLYLVALTSSLLLRCLTSMTFRRMFCRLSSIWSIWTVR